MKSFLKRSLPLEIQLAVPIPTAPIFRSVTSSKSFWETSKRYVVTPMKGYHSDEELSQVKNAECPFTLILDDPLANSYLQNLYAPDPDPNMVIELYDRSWEQNEELGLNDMKVEGYEQEVDKAEG
jgi:hypothetical protein